MNSPFCFGLSFGLGRSAIVRLIGRDFALEREWISEKIRRGQDSDEGNFLKCSGEQFCHDGHMFFEDNRTRLKHVMC